MAAGVRALRDLRPVGRLPLTVAVGATGSFGDGAAGRGEQLAQGISHAYGRPLDEVLDIPLVGEPAAVADRLARYADVGAQHVVVGLAGDGWQDQCAALAEIRTLLRA